MIIDKFSNLKIYIPLLKNLENGLEAIQAAGVPEIGTYEFDGGYFMVKEGTTGPIEEGDFEVHRRYVDIQIVLEGSEDLAWTHLDNLTETIPYDEKRDAAFCSGDITCQTPVAAGMCYILFPWDGHKAVRHVKQPQDYKKIVMKLLIE